MPSSALAEFQSSIALAEALQQLETAYPDPPQPAVPNQVETVRALRGGAVVLMVGAFEGFVRQTIEEHVAKLATVPPPRQFDDLPEAMRLNSVFRSLDLAMRGPRHGSPKGRAARLTDIKTAAHLIVQGLLDPKALSATDGNADAGAVSDLLKNLGIAEPFNQLRATFDREWAKPEAQQFVHDKLNSVVLSRHRVAHAASVLNVGRDDVETGIRFLKALAVAIDELLEGYIATI